MEIDLKLDGNNLYREESFTDMKTGAVRRLTPVKSDGSEDESREAIFIAQTQLMSPEGALPVSAMLEAKTLAEAIQVFPEAVKKEVERIVEIAQKAKQEDSSRIIVPGQDDTHWARTPLWFPALINLRMQSGRGHMDC